MLRLVEFYIPQEKILPEIMNTLTPEEKYLMLKIGCECLKEGREAISKLSQQELTQKIKEETKKEVVKLETELLIERETTKRFEEKISYIYEKEKFDERERQKYLLNEKLFEIEVLKNKYEKKTYENENSIKNLEMELNLEKERTKIKEIEKMNMYDVKINILNAQLNAYENNFEDILKNKLRIEMDTQTFILEEKNKQIEKQKETFVISVSNYEKEKEQLNKKISILNEQIKLNQDDTSNIFNSKMEYEKEKSLIQLNQEKTIYKGLLDEKQKQVDHTRDNYEKQLNKIRETYETILTSNNKSTSLKGSEGEKKFEEYADIFKDFKGFKFFDKHTKGGEGDFHLHFEEFNVLVDAKNYKKKVPVDQRDKIKSDLLKNEHIQFGWLVSLNTAIDKFDRSPIMYEWINPRQCLVYINNLSGFDEPSKILRILWFTCKELNKLIENSVYDVNELVELKEHKFIMMDKIKNLRKNVKEANTSINTLKNVMQTIDDQLKYILDSETTEIVKSNSSVFDDWWDTNIELLNNDDITVNVTDIWFKFKQDNKDILKDFEITVEKFKNYIKTKMPAATLVMKNKNVNSAFDIKGIKIINI